MHHSENPWLLRIQAVGRAQSRYLYVLLLFCAFFWALRGKAGPALDNSRIRLPMVDLEIEGLVLLSIAPVIIGLLLRALLGTFPALRHAHEEMGNLEHPFEAFATNPTALEFAIYTKKTGFSHRLGLLSYPLVLTLAYAEAYWLWYEAFAYAIVARQIASILGLLVLIWCLLPLISLWRSRFRDLADLEWPARHAP